MDIGNKIYSSIMFGQILKIFCKHGVKCQFGSTHGVRCQDGTFTIKKLLHLRHNHYLPTWVAFVDLVKAFDTSNRTLYLFQPQMGQFTKWTSTVPVKGTQFRVHVLGSKTLF